MRHRAAVGAIGHQIELVVDHGSVTGEHDYRQVLARAARHVAIHRGERIGDAVLVRLAGVQKHRLDPGLETARLRIEQRARDVLRVARSEVEFEVPRLVAIVTYANGQHMEPRSRALRRSGDDLHVAPGGVRDHTAHGRGRILLPWAEPPGANTPTARRRAFRSLPRAPPLT